RKERALGPVRLALDGVTTRRVEEISFEVRAGEIVGLGGLVGAGRTEVARAIVGLDPLLSGQMTVGGRPYRPREPADAVGAGIGLVLLIVPGIILWLGWSMAVPVLIQERLGVFGSMSRSRVLTKGNRWSLFGLFLILIIIAMVIQWGMLVVL
ncbi:ATP-binding cassette domain-containing protein, partial [Mesorhizobium sp. M2D.F.Ca.ET.226.01.1.1]|uniref:ATP-binding cassette domain-containing protein n=1 Tax=Mesorhizobium sp. M2D.F.Ca.ET.226.01.1.1 TaxID=2496668 RepID=UPI0032B2FDF7